MRLNDINPKIKFKNLRLSRSGVAEAVIDIAAGRLSRTDGPLQILKNRQLTDGYHRLVEAIFNGLHELSYELVPNDNAYPIIGGWFKVQNTPLQGLEDFIADLDQEQLQKLKHYPAVANSIANGLV